MILTNEAIKAALRLSWKTFKVAEVEHLGVVYNLDQTYDSGQDYLRGPRIYFRQGLSFIWVSDYNENSVTADVLISAIANWKMKAVHAL